MIDVEQIKKDFPILLTDPGLTYLDSTATSLKPHSVIKKLTDYYTHYSANIFRGVYDISEKATGEYEETRTVVKDFIQATSEKEIIFTRNTTESINLFVNGIEHKLHEGDEVMTTILEHHSNFVPWQQLCKRKKMQFTIVTNEMVDSLMFPVSKKTKVLALTYVSNVVGTINPVKKIIQEARRINPDILILIDGAQAVPHMSIDVVDLGCDAFAFSSHKMLGPTGVGVLWVKRELLEELKPYQYGGEMIRRVQIENTEFADLPHRFEAGTPHIAGVIALKEAIYYLEKIGLDNIHVHEQALAQYCFDELTSTFKEKIRIIGPEKRESGIVAFTFGELHAHDAAQLLNEDGVAVRAGHHCAMPLHEKLGIEASLRASFYIYNTKKDVDTLITSLKRALQFFSLKK